jgi:hypothetical protein
MPVNPNAPDRAEPILSTIGDLPAGQPAAFEAAFRLARLVEYGRSRTLPPRARPDAG